MSQVQLLNTRRFGPLFLTQFFGAFNDNFLKNALVLLIAYHTTQILGIPSSQMVAAAGGIFILPFFLFSAQAGQLADKYEKSHLIRWVKFAEIGIMLIATVGFLRHSYELLLGCLFLMGCHSTVFGPLKYAILPQHLSESEIVGGNALVEAGTFLAILLGTIAGGILGDVPGGVVWISVGLVACAILGWITSLWIPLAESVDPTLKIKWNPITPTIEILRFTRETRSVFLSILGVSWFWMFGGAILSVFPDYCKDFLHAEGHVVTLFLSIFSIGIGLGSLLVEKLSRRHLELGLVPLGSIGMTLFTIDLFLVGLPRFAVRHTAELLPLSRFLHEPQGWRIVGDLLGLAIFSGFFIVPLLTLVQQRSSVAHRSRIIAGNNILNALFMVWGAGQLMLMMYFGLKVPQMFLTLALMNTAVAIYIYTLLPEFFLRFLVWCLANLIYRLKVEGADEIPKEGPAVLVCNHVSFVDWMIIAAGVSRPIRFIMTADFAKGPLMKMLVRQAKIIPIAPAKENKALLEEAFRRAAEELRAGELICIFPEGKITYDGNMNPFRPGVERLIQETPVPVVPMAIINLWGSYFSRESRGVWKRPKRFLARIRLRIGTPVPPSAVKADLLFSRVQELLTSPPRR